MELFLDTIDIDKISSYSGCGLVDGITTNPSLVAKLSVGENVDPASVLRELLVKICSLVEGSVSVEIVAKECQDFVDQAKRLLGAKEIDTSKICIKLPMTFEGIKACSILSRDNIKTNVTLCFNANQALLAAKAGATYVSPFVGRLDDNGYDGLALVEDIVTIYENYGFTTKVLAASIRTVEHVHQLALIGAHVATVPVNVFEKLLAHVLTDKGIEQFDSDWQKSGFDKVFS